MKKAFLLLLMTGALAACDKAELQDPIVQVVTRYGNVSLADKLYHNTTPEINSLQERNRLPDWSGWYRHNGKYYMKGQILYYTNRLRHFDLPILRCSVSTRLSLRLAHEFTLIGISVPPRSGIVINTSSRIHPNPPVIGRLNKKRTARRWSFL
jgi:hypothetical protein